MSIVDNNTDEEGSLKVKLQGGYSIAIIILFKWIFQIVDWPFIYFFTTRYHDDDVLKRITPAFWTKYKKIIVPPVFQFLNSSISRHSVVWFLECRPIECPLYCLHFLFPEFRH